MATRKPPCTRALWRGVVVCSHSVPKLNAWAVSIGNAIRLTPLAGCGSYQTSTKASAGTHAGGGAIDITGNGMTSTQRTMVARKGREVGLQVAWFRPYRANVWTNHFHALDPDCPQLASVAAGQCVDCFNNDNGLVGTAPDDGWRGNIPQLKTIFGNRLYTAVADIVTGIGGIGGAVVADAASDATRVKNLQRYIGQPQSGAWDVETDIDLRNIRAIGREGYTGAYFRRWSLYSRKRIQRTVAAGQDGIWGPATAGKVKAAVRFIQTTIGVKADGIWGAAGETEKAYQALKARTDRPYRLIWPYGAFPAPAKGAIFGPSRAGRAWYSGKSAGTLRTRAQIQHNIRQIQRITGTVADGSYGQNTVNAVIKWQKANKVIPSDGLVGPVTWAAMAKKNGRA